jgi:Cu+-exporting ATPase
METIVTPETQVRDPVCGMTVTPKTAAGMSTRNGETSYFCSSGCMTQFDTGADAQHAHTAEGIHAHHAVAGGHAHAGVETEAHTTQTEEAQERAYRTLMAKFWFGVIIGIPVLFTMFIDLIPALQYAFMPWHQVMGIAAALLTFPVLAWSGDQFFTGAWNNFRNHNANMDTLVALGTGAAWLYSTLVALAPSLFPPGTAGMYFDVAVIVITLVVLGQALEIRAKSRSSAAIQRLLSLQAKTARVVRGGKEVDIPIEDVVTGDTVLVRPGEKVPVDGVILQGESAIDESLVTG